MLSLSEQLHNFLAEWEANQQMAGKAGVGEGVCDYCKRNRYVQYAMQFDRGFCSSQCVQRYEQLIKTGMTYAGKK